MNAWVNTNYMKSTETFSNLLCKVNEDQEIESIELADMRYFYRAEGNSFSPVIFLLSFFNYQELICFLSLVKNEAFYRLFTFQSKTFTSQELNFQKKLISYIHKYYNCNDLQVNGIASGIYMSTRSLQIRSLGSTQLRPSELLTVYRIIRSCVEIISTCKNIEDIAFENGFKGYSNFNRNFNKYVELSPRAYRKQFAHLLYLF